MSKFKTKTIEDTEMIYSILRERYPERQIQIEFNDNTKEYVLYLTDEKYIEDPEVPVDLKIKVIYGDSVTGDTPLVLKKNNQVYIETIGSIFNEKDKIEYPGFKMFDKTIRLEKEYCLSDYQIWCDNGWVDIKKVIRHKCDKKMYRVLTHTGCIDVTEDHSLINSNLEPIKPGELKIGDSLSHTFPTEFVENNETIVKMKKDITETKIHSLRNIIKNFKFEDYSLTEKEAEVWGFFQGNGSCGTYHYKSGIKNSWVLNNNNLERLNYFKDILESVEPIKFEILDTLKPSGVYKLVPKGSIKYMVDKYSQLFYYQKDCNVKGDKYKRVPNCILNASKEIKLAYWKGYWGTGSYVNNPSFAVKGKIGAQSMYYLMRSIGINMSIHLKKKEIYFLGQTNFKIKNEFDVKKIIEKESQNDYVYDIETTIGRFSAGVGQLQINNTDSIFLSLKYNREDFSTNRVDTFKLATICGDNLTEDVFNRRPIEMEFEKVFQPFILLTKKRYIGKKYENMKDPFKLKEITKSGIAITRRDYCKMVKDCYLEVIDCIVNENSGGLEESIEIYKNYIDKIDNYQINIEDLVVSAMLAKTYKTKPVHVQLAEKLKERNEEVQIGDRIPYIYIESNDSTIQKSELGEDPKYAIEHNLKFNRKCYLEQLAKPLLGFFKCVLSNNEEALDDIINYTNEKLVEYGGAKLKPSDYKMKEE